MRNVDLLTVIILITFNSKKYYFHMKLAICMIPAIKKKMSDYNDSAFKVPLNSYYLICGHFPRMKKINGKASNKFGVYTKNFCKM